MAQIRIYDLSKPHLCLTNYKMFAGIPSPPWILAHQERRDDVNNYYTSKILPISVV